MLGRLLLNSTVRPENHLSIFVRSLIALGTKVFSLSYHCLVSTSPSLNGLVPIYLIGQIDGFLSKFNSINAGINQDSAASPVLFILFINDLLSSTSFSVYSFTDDTYLSSPF